MIGTVMEPGVIVDEVGTYLIAEAAAGSAVLAVESLSGFVPFGTLLLDGQPVAYSSTDSTLNLITLASPLAGAALEGTSVQPLDATGQVPVAWYVRLDVDDDPAAEGHLTAIPDHMRIGYKVGDFSVGQTVEYGLNPADDSGELVVLQRPATTPIIDGTYIDPTTVPEYEPTDPPAGPVVSVYPMADSLLVQVEPIAPSTVLDVYVSDALGFTPSPSTLVVQGTRSTIVTVTALADGTPLAQEITYGIVVVARNAAGEVAAPEVASALDPSRASELVIARITTGNIAAGAVDIGGVIRLNPTEGFAVAHPDGTETRINADGSGAIFSGAGQFNSVAAERLAILGAASTVEGLLTLANGVKAPPAPRVSRASYPQMQTDLDMRFRNRGLVDVGSAWLTLTAGYGGTNILAVDEVSGAAVLALQLSDLDGFGVAALGANTYVLGWDASREGWYLYRYNASWAKTGEVKVTASAGASLALGSDGTDLLVAGRNPDGALWVRKYAGLTPGATTACGSWTDATLVGVVSDGTRWLIASTKDVLAYATDGTRRVAYDILTASAQTVGIWWDGTALASLGSNGRIYTYSPVRTATARSVTATAANGTYETTASPARSWTQQPGQWMRVETDPQVSGGDPNRPDRVRFYVDNQRQSSLAAGVWSERIGTPVAGPTAPTTNGFDAVTTSPGAVRSDAKAGDGRALTNFGGDGSARAMKMLQAGSLTVTPAAAGTEYTVSVTFNEPFASEPVVDVRSRLFQSSLTGPRPTAVSAAGFSFTYTKADTTPWTATWIAAAITQA